VVWYSLDSAEPVVQQLDSDVQARSQLVLTADKCKGIRQRIAVRLSVTHTSPDECDPLPQH